MLPLKDRHSDVAKAFVDGKFTVQKTKHAFSCIAIDHAYEQNNAIIKGEGGAVGLTHNPSAFHRWMVSGPEVSRLNTESEETIPQMIVQEHQHHHDQKTNVQNVPVKNVQSLIATIEELGNPFQELSTDLIALDTKEIANPSSLKTVQDAKVISQYQFDEFWKDCLIEGKM